MEPGGDGINANALAEYLFGGPQPVFSFTEKDLEARIQPTISPSDPKWIRVHQGFDKLLHSDQTIGQVLSRHFTESEVRMFSCSDQPELKTIQNVHTERYENLLKGRFRHVSKDLPTKLTMMYFGLPVAPMEFGPTTLMDTFEKRKPEDPRFDVKPPLHFLTAHKNRNWGNDDLRGQEDDVGPLPVPIPQGPLLRLRGGGDDDADVDNSDPEDLGSLEDFGGDSNSDEGGDQSIDYVPETEPPVAHVDPDPRGWVDLHGFQGIVPFVPGNWATYATAVRRLLSLRWDQDAKFSLVRYDKKGLERVDQVFDTLPLSQGSLSMKYICKLFDKNWEFHYGSSAFFVMFQVEQAPTTWQPPLESQTLGFHAMRIKSALPEAPDKNRPPISYCYVSLPKLDQAKSSSDRMHEWDANQFSIYFRTALEVLLGRPDSTRFIHAFHSLFLSGDFFKAIPQMYGLANMSPSHLASMLLHGSGDMMELKQVAIADDEFAFVLPGYHPAGINARLTTAKRILAKSTFTSNEQFPTATRVIRNMVKSFLGKEAQKIQHVRLLVGSFILGPERIEEHPYCSIPMSDDIQDKTEESMDEMLAQLMEIKAPVVALYPEWKEHDTFIYAGWTGQFLDEAICVSFPSLSSPVKLFRRCVVQLLNLTANEPRTPRNVVIDKCYVSIQGVLGPHGDSTSSDNVIDLPCFHIGPQTTDEEWFKIRARIPTRRAVVRIIDQGQYDWNAQLSRGNTWGPRYGYLAELSLREGSRIGSSSRRCELVESEIAGKYTPNMPHKEATASKDANLDVASMNAPGLAGSSSSKQPKQLLTRGFDPREAPLDHDDRRRTWASQPSIFDGNSLLTWPANSGIRLPMTAPPVESMLRVSHNVPMVSKSILTPTEQARLQKSFWELRNLMLGRISKCSYDGCHFTYKNGEEDSLAQHLESTHLARKCIWCDDPLYEHWTDKQRTTHLRQKHRSELMEALGVTRATVTDHEGKGSVSIPLKRVSRHHIGEGLAMIPRANFVSASPVPQPQPVLQQFCDRCGRDRAQFFNDSEKGYHDRNCKPGIYNDAKCRFCKACGSQYWLTVADAQQSGMSHGDQGACKHKKDDANGHHCHLCGFDVGTLPIDGQQRHEVNCKGYGSLIGRFCCYCGTTFVDNHTVTDLQHRVEHMRQCFSQLAAGNQASVDGTFDLSVIEARPQSKMLLGLTQTSTVEKKKGLRVREGKLMGANQDAELRAVIKKAQNIDAAQDVMTDIQRHENPGGPSDPALLVIVSKPRAARTPIPIAKSTLALAKTVKPAEPQVKIESISPELKVKVRTNGKGKGKRKRDDKEDSDKDYEDSEDEDDEEEEGEQEVETEGEGDPEDSSSSKQPTRPKKPLRRAKSPDWNTKLGPEDPNFEPKPDYHCSKCFRRAPSKPHKRARSPLGPKKEKELHVDKNRCCRIRNGLGSAENLPNRSGWIPASQMPKPLTAFRKNFIKKYPAYARTLYPLNEANRNGSYWRSDPNHDDNAKWWDIPWPAYRGDPPFPSWEAPDASAQDDAGQSARKRQEFKLRAAPDPNYKYQSDEDVDEDVDGLVPDEQSPSRKKRRRGRSPGPKAANPLPLADRVTVPMTDDGTPGTVKGTARMKKSAPSRPKTGGE